MVSCRCDQASKKLLAKTFEDIITVSKKVFEIEMSATSWKKIFIKHKKACYKLTQHNLKSGRDDENPFLYKSLECFEQFYNLEHRKARYDLHAQFVSTMAIDFNKNKSPKRKD